eukprot:6198146-Pleurochrysis_carterae.AAC.6
MERSPQRRDADGVENMVAVCTIFCSQRELSKHREIQDIWLEWTYPYSTWNRIPGPSRKNHHLVLTDMGFQVDWRRHRELGPHTKLASDSRKSIMSGMKGAGSRGCNTKMHSHTELSISSSSADMHTQTDTS